MKYEIHPAADEFPMLDESRLADLVKDIREHGQREPIKLLDGKVLDGRNRLKACEQLGVEPQTISMPSDTDPWAYVWSLNGERRDLVAVQRYAIWDSCAEHSRAWQAKQREIHDAANKARAEKAKAGKVGRAAAKAREFSGTTTCGPTNLKQPNRQTATAKAKASNTNRGAVETWERIKRADSELAQKVKQGEVPASRAVQEIRRREKKQELEQIAAKEVEAPTGVYDVIVIDPPWPMQKINRDCRPNQVAFDYPTMTIKEIAGLNLPAAENCHLFAWTTQKFLPDALACVKGWGFKYTLCMVWHKPGGPQPYGLPQYNCEFVVYARRGVPEFIDTTAFPTCFSAPRGSHSEKPEQFYELLRRVTAGRRLDMFNRRKIEGFAGWGNETLAA